MFSNAFPIALFSKNKIRAVITNAAMEQCPTEGDKNRGYGTREELESFPKEAGVVLTLIGDFYNLRDDVCMCRRQLTDPTTEVGLLKVDELKDCGIKRKQYQVAWLLACP